MYKVYIYDLFSRSRYGTIYEFKSRLIQTKPRQKNPRQCHAETMTMWNIYKKANKLSRRLTRRMEFRLPTVFTLNRLKGF